ncbi:RNA-binding protein 1-like isoform X2 [Diospyros lotus]|uniref:RNA-binding protein 1-like isoform X2 n=1 Tax=Diospyros lotus TaxID=55363 RepID=UPI002257531B|nr:RNA-binding protein 1-like isoform X2 [Diospyros lotus]
MGDPYYRYGAPADGGSIPRSGFPDYLPPEPTRLAPHHLWSSRDLRGNSQDYAQKEILPLRPGAYGVDDTKGIGVHPEPGFGGLTAGASIKGYQSPLQDPHLLAQRRDVAAGIVSGTRDLINERHGSLPKVDGLPHAARDSNILFVDGLPTDCSRREVGHLFRPFIGFKDIRVVHKEPRRSGDKALVLCFVEFADAKCALTAMEALQGYKFDDRKPDSPILRIHFAHFPFHLPSDRQ